MTHYLIFSPVFCFPFAQTDSMHVNGEETVMSQICRYISDSEAKSNAQLANHFNNSHKCMSKLADCLAAIGKVLTAKVSAGTTFSLV